MRISILHYVLLTVFAVVLISIGTIFGSLDTDGFAAFEARFDLSDAILTTIILGLMAVIPVKERTKVRFTS